MPRKKTTKRILQCRNKTGETFSVGDVVTLNSRAIKTYASHDILPMPTTIDSFFNDIKDLALLTRPIGGYHTWDVNDLTLIRSRHESK